MVKLFRTTINPATIKRPFMVKSTTGWPVGVLIPKETLRNAPGHLLSAFFMGRYKPIAEMPLKSRSSAKSGALVIVAPRSEARRAGSRVPRPHDQQHPEDAESGCSLTSKTVITIPFSSASC